MARRPHSSASPLTEIMLACAKSTAQSTQHDNVVTSFLFALMRRAIFYEGFQDCRDSERRFVQLDRAHGDAWRQDLCVRLCKHNYDGFPRWNRQGSNEISAPRTCGGGFFRVQFIQVYLGMIKRHRRVHFCAINANH